MTPSLPLLSCRVILMKYATFNNYIEVLKPRATALLTFIGVCAAIIAGDGYPPLNRVLLAFLAILLSSAGANGLTNYLDRNVDARMARTCQRSLPSKRINPPEKVLPLTIGLLIVGLAVSWWLHPFVFLSGIGGTLAAAVWRKQATCIFPQGMLASCAPVLMGWFAITPVFRGEVLLLCGLISVWLPLHVWSVMLAHRQDYIDAGLTYFPMSRPAAEAIKLLLLFSLILGALAMTLYFIGGFAQLYLIAAILLTILMIYATARLVISRASGDAWKLYKLSSFPYLGLIFLAMILDVWLL